MFIVSLAFLAVFIFSCSVTHLVLCKLEHVVLLLPQISFTSISIIINPIDFWCFVRMRNCFHQKLTWNCLPFLFWCVCVCGVWNTTVGKDGDEEFIEIVKKAPFSVIVTLICFFSIWSVIGLAGFHTYLTTSDQTTNEDVNWIFSSVAFADDEFESLIVSYFPHNID